MAACILAQCQCRTQGPQSPLKAVSVLESRVLYDIVFRVSRITNNANKSLGFLRRNLKTKNTSLRENAYKAIVRPQLEYASPVWDPHTKDDIQKIESVQRRAARWVLGDYSPYSSVTKVKRSKPPLVLTSGFNRLKLPRSICQKVVNTDQ